MVEREREQRESRERAEREGGKRERREGKRRERTLILSINQGIFQLELPTPRHK